MSQQRPIYLSQTLMKHLEKGKHPVSVPLEATAAALDITKMTRREFLHVIQGLDENLDFLEFFLTGVQDVIAILEEAGGLSVRARNFMQDSGGYDKYKDKLDELEDWYRNTLVKLDSRIEDCVASNGLNLLKGDSLIISFDSDGRSTLNSQGLDLTAGGLGIRQPDFSSLHNIQNARIDVANSIDLAVTLRHILSSDITTIKTRREFCESALSLLGQIQDDLSSGGVEADEFGHYSELCGETLFAEDDLPLAEEAQATTLTQFKTA